MVHNFRKKFKNVEIRQLDVADLEFLRSWRNNPNNTKFLRRMPYITSEMQKKWFSSYLEDANEMIFAIDEIDKIQQVVGSMSIYNIDIEQAEVGKILVGNPNAHGLDVCRNALIAVMDIVGKELGLKKLYLHVYKENIPAVKVYTKVGFSIDSEYLADNGLIECIMSINV